MSNQELPLLRKATAVWLVENTALTFKQIADFCGLHELEVQGIADEDVAFGIIGQSPVHSSQLTEEEIKRCEADETASLKLSENAARKVKTSGKKAGKYTPIARRGDKPDGIAYLLKYHPELTNLQIKKLIGTTDKMIDSIRGKTYWDIKNIKPRDVVLLGLCSQSQFNDVIDSMNKDDTTDKGSSKKTSAAKKTTAKKTAAKKSEKESDKKITEATAKKATN